MAIATSTIWEVRTTGSDLNGGGFYAARGGSDYSQQDSAQLSLTDLACVTASTTLTSATGGFTASMVGNVINIASGTNAVAGFYEIIVYTNTNTVTIDRTCASGGDMSSGVGKVGGALASLGTIASVVTVSNVVYVKSGTYVITTSTTNVPNGLWSPSTSVNRAWNLIEGYENVRGDLSPNRPLIQMQSALGSNLNIFQSTYAVSYLGWYSCTIRNLKIDGNNNTGVQAATGGYGSIRLEQCEILNCYVVASSSVFSLFCYAHNCTIGFMGHTVNCLAKTCTTGFLNDYESTRNNTGGGYRRIGCIAYDCSYGFRGPYSWGGATDNGTLIHVSCSAIACSVYGFESYQILGAQSGSTPYAICWLNCLAYGCGSYGFRTLSGHKLYLKNCAGGMNTSGNVLHALIDDEFITISEHPYPNIENNDYTLNPQLVSIQNRLFAMSEFFPEITFNTYTDIGAVQHEDRYTGRLAKIVIG